MDGAREHFATATQRMMVDAGFLPRLQARHCRRDPLQSSALFVFVLVCWLWAEQRKSMERDHRLLMDTLHDHDPIRDEHKREHTSETALQRGMSGQRAECL